jgi:hypothetical protein
MQNENDHAKCASAEMVAEEVCVSLEMKVLTHLPPIGCRVHVHVTHAVRVAHHGDLKIPGTKIKKETN